MSLAILQDYINNNGLSDTATSILKYSGLLGVIGVIVMTPLVFSLFGGRVSTTYFHKQFILYSLFWSFILISSVNIKGVIQRFFTLSALRFYGALSFSVYLFHPIFIIFIKAERKVQLNGYLSAWVVLLASTVAAYISFRVLEGPISKYKIGKGHLRQ